MINSITNNSKLITIKTINDMRENLLKKQPTWGLRRALGTGHKSVTPATLTKVIWVLLTMLLLPSAAWGQDPTITVAGITHDATTGPITGDGITSGTVSFDALTNTLTLENATLGTENSYLGNIVSGLDALTINLQGKNKLYGTITCSSDNSTSDNATLAFTGNGSLEISGESSTINGFTSVDFGEFNLASKSAPGIHWEVDDQALRGYANSARDVIITKDTYYPIWVYDPTLGVDAS
jgi:hypothetical protein